MTSNDQICAHLMPIGYGSGRLPATSSYRRVGFLAIPFITDRDQLQALLPPLYSVGQRPIVTVSQQMIGGVDYLGGRSYNIAQVMADVVYEYSGRLLRGSYPLGVWETDTIPIVAGRELLGTPKLYGCIPDLSKDESGWTFECAEYGAELLRGRATGMAPVNADRFSRMRESMRKIRTLAWKYVPGPGGTADADYPLTFTQEVDFDQIWLGAGEVTWGEPSFAEAPISAAIISTLRRLPIREYLPALAGEGPAKLLRSELERLPCPPRLECAAHSR
jgi:acetoacetate decarboxylase